MTNQFLIVGGASSALAAVLHLGCILFGASWYRFFGAGERMVRLAASGSIVPSILTAGIAVVLALWALYAFSAAGVIPRLPLARLVLCGITGIYLLRGLAGLALALVNPGDRGVAFWVWSSMICLCIGTLYLVGTQQAWSQLARNVA